MRVVLRPRYVAVKKVRVTAGTSTAADKKVLRKMSPLSVAVLRDLR